MATGNESIVRIVEVTDVLPTTVDRTATTLMRPKTDLWPVSGKGGGRSAVHVEPHHMVNLLFGLVADQPSGAETAARLLRDTYADADEKAQHD